MSSSSGTTSAPSPAAATSVEAMKPVRHPATTAWLIALLGWTTIMSFYGLDRGAEFEPTDAWVGQTAREMSESRSWLGWFVPRFSGETRMQKSPGAYWAVCAVSGAMGRPIDERIVRIPNAILAVLLVGSIFWLARRIAGDRAAVFAGFAAASSVMVLFWSHRGASDLGVTALMSFALAALWIGLEDTPGRRAQNRLLFLGYFSAGLAMLYKQPMPIVCVGLPFFLYVIAVHGWRTILDRRHLIGLAVFALPWLPWMIVVLMNASTGEPSYTGESPGFLTILHKWRVEYWDRITGALPNVQGQQREWQLYVLYLLMVFVFTAPWCLSVPMAIGRAFRSSPDLHRRGAWFLLIWFFSLLIFFEIAAGKETRYILPLLPPVFVLLGRELARFFDPARPVSPALDRIGIWAVVIGLVATSVPSLLYLRKKVNELSGMGYAVYGWSDIWPPLVTTLVIFGGGAVLCAWLRARRREHAAFGALVAGMWLAWAFAWPALVPVLATEKPFIDFAEQIRDRLTTEQKKALRQVAQQDSRVIWYSDVRYPRVIDQLELLRRQGGQRDQLRERVEIATEMVNGLRSTELALYVTELESFIVFTEGAGQVLAQRGESMPPHHVWIVGRVGRPDHRMIVFGNQPPPWESPGIEVSEKVRAQARAQVRELLERLKSNRSDAAPAPQSQPITTTRPLPPMGRREPPASAPATAQPGASAAPMRETTAADERSSTLPASQESAPEYAP